MFREELLRTGGYRTPSEPLPMTFLTVRLYFPTWMVSPGS